MKHALVTGGAGFIGSHLVDRLLEEGWQVTVVDNFDPFYDPLIKRRNIEHHMDYESYSFLEVDVRDLEGLRANLSGEYDVIVHLAARPGVRPSLHDPILYQDINIRGTQNLLEFARERAIKHFVFASSSSVYGANSNVPWRESDVGLKPISPYAATKVAGELLGHAYSHLYGIRFVALRFFTVYGPRQRPDLAVHKFVRKLLSGDSIPVYGDGSARRDYTYIDDVIDGVRAAMDYRQTMYEVFNLGNNNAIGTLEMIRLIEDVLGVNARLQFLPDQPGDVPQTWADITKAERLLGYRPRTPLREGLQRFVEWFVGHGVHCWSSGRK